MKKELKSDLKEIAAYQTAIRYIKTGFGGGHIRKHIYDFDTDCANCQSMFVVGFLEQAIDLIKWCQMKTKKK